MPSTPNYPDYMVEAPAGRGRRWRVMRRQVGTKKAIYREFAIFFNEHDATRVMDALGSPIE